MRNKKIIDAWNKVEPKEEAQKRMLTNILEQSSKSRARNWRPIATAAAAIVVLLSGTFIYHINTATQKPGSKAPGGYQSSVDQDLGSNDIAELSDEIKGLPVKDFKMSDIEQLATADRIAFFNFINFFEYNLDSFVIVKVAETKAIPAEEYSSERQISTVKILETVWGDHTAETIDITQHLYGGCTGDEATNLMRKGGVYLLPLVEDNGEYYLMSDLDVLFEIDDEGLIWSHSDFEDFNRFDGKNYQEVVDEIHRITQDETTMLAASGFGMALRGFQLAEITVISEGIEEKNDYGFSEIAYSAQVDHTLSGTELPEEISVRSYSEENLPLTKGGKYLLFIDNYDEKHYINTNMIAKVEADGTIQKLGNDKNPFEPYGGYSMEEIQQMADQVMEYYQSNQ